MENNTFKGSLFGGFNRQDVMNYIEKASKESAALLQEKDAQINALEQQVQELSAQQAQLHSELQNIMQRYDQTCQALTEAQKACVSAQDSLQKAEEQAARDADEQKRLTTTLEGLQQEVDEYHKLKNNIAEVEVEAKHRADTIVAEAKANAESLLQ